MRYNTTMIMKKKDMDELYDAITQLQYVVWLMEDSDEIVYDNAETTIHIEWLDAETADCCNFLRSGIAMTGAALSMLSNVLHDIYRRCIMVGKDAAVSDEIKKKIKESEEEIHNLFILDR
jgi:hypothetical protein